MRSRRGRWAADVSVSSRIASTGDGRFFGRLSQQKRLRQNFESRVAGRRGGCWSKSPGDGGLLDRRDALVRQCNNSQLATVFSRSETSKGRRSKSLLKVSEAQSPVCEVLLHLQRFASFPALVSLAPGSCVAQRPQPARERQSSGRCFEYSIQRLSLLSPSLAFDASCLDVWRTPGPCVVPWRDNITILFAGRSLRNSFETRAGQAGGGLGRPGLRDEISLEDPPRWMWPTW